ncbi:MAG: LptF/LptG family permease, partial [Paracoccaceae bacterium]|nr:LptF/LptG family permease [Paracoccaceae bacterium]
MRFDRYVLSQLTTLFGFFTLVLVAVYWLNRVVLLFNKIVGDGQSMRSFLELSLLSLPDVIRTMLPLAAFISALYVVNRMSSDSELVVVHAVGVSPARLARPVLVFGALVAVLLAVLSNYLVPVSRTALADRMAAISRNITAKVLTEGKFIHPTDGVTLFVRKITPLGEMQDLFLSDGRSTVSRTTYSAQRALLVPVATGPKLVMFDGT